MNLTKWANVKFQWRISETKSWIVKITTMFVSFVCDSSEDWKYSLPCCHPHLLPFYLFPLLPTTHAKLITCWPFLQHDIQRGEDEEGRAGGARKREWKCVCVYVCWQNLDISTRKFRQKKNSSGQGWVCFLMGRLWGDAGISAI